MENVAITQGCLEAIALSILSIARRTQCGPGESLDKVITECCFINALPMRDEIYNLCF